MLKESEAHCPTCNQKLNNESKQNATKKFKEDLLDKYAKQTKLKEQFKQKHFDRIACQGKIISSETDNNFANIERINLLEENIKILEAEKQENSKLHNEYCIKLENIKKAQSDIKNLKEEIKTTNILIQESKNQCLVAQKLYFNSIKAKMQIADNYLKDVKIRFYKVIKETGEIKDDFVITYKNKDYNTLSRSEKIAVSLEIANMLNKISGINSPLFIDDSESYPDFDFINEYSDTQIFIAQVKKGQKLNITNCKDKIKGYTSNVTLHRKTKNKKQLISVA